MGRRPGTWSSGVGRGTGLPGIANLTQNQFLPTACKLSGIGSLPRCMPCISCPAARLTRPMVALPAQSAEESCRPQQPQPGSHLAAADLLYQQQVLTQGCVRRSWGPADAPGTSQCFDSRQQMRSWQHCLALLHCVCHRPAAAGQGRDRCERLIHSPGIAHSPPGCSPIQLLLGLMGGTFPKVGDLFKVPFDIYSQAVKK